MPPAGILDPRVGGPDGVPDAISRDERLTPEQKQSLLTVYESFVGAGSAGAGSRRTP